MKNSAIKIVKTLQSNGFIAYFAGGYVRDMLLGKESKDIDIVTSAKPKEIEKLFENTYSIGKKFAVINVVIEKHNFEVATFREESNYSDYRRPTEIKFSDAKHDALRRDFTINGMFYDPIKNKLIDFVGGSDDIKKRTIRFIGDPKERINEDHLRLIRAIRFKSVLNFQYDKETFEALRKYSNLITTVSAERVRDELNKIIKCPNRHTGLVELSQSGILKLIIPEIENLKSVPQPNQYHKEGDVFTHTYLALKSLSRESSLTLCWATLLHDIGKPDTIIRKSDKIIFHNHAQKSAQITESILRRLKFSLSDIKAITFLVENHMRIFQVDKMRPSKRFRFLTSLYIDDLIKLTEADQKGKIPSEMDFVRKLKKEVKEARAKQLIITKEKREKIFSGKTLIKLGFNPSPKFKDIIENIEDLIASGELNNKKQVEDYILKNYEQNK